MGEKYFCFCSRTLWLSGFLSGCCPDGDVLTASDGGLYISKSLDSGENGTVWRSAEIDCTDGKIDIRVYSSDVDYIIHDGDKIFLDDVFLSTVISDGQKKEFFYSLEPVSIPHGDNVPLFMLSGRYLWFMLEFHCSDKPVKIKELCIYYPMAAYLNLLPEMYGKLENTFLQSFMAVFRGEVDRIDKKIVDIHKEFDAELVSESGLNRLVKWHGLPVSDIWGIQCIRELVKNAEFLYRMKGTKAALERLLNILLSYTPKILENRYSGTAENNDFLFSIYVKADLIKSAKHFDELKCMVNHFKPAGTVAAVILIRRDSYLSESSFLDENAVLADLSKNTLDSDAYISDDYFDSGIIL